MVLIKNIKPKKHGDSWFFRIPAYFIKSKDINLKKSYDLEVKIRNIKREVETKKIEKRKKINQS